MSLYDCSLHQRTRTGETESESLQISRPRLCQSQRSRNSASRINLAGQELRRVAGCLVGVVVKLPKVDDSSGHRLGPLHTDFPLSSEEQEARTEAVVLAHQSRHWLEKGKRVRDRHPGFGEIGLISPEREEGREANPSLNHSRLEPKWQLSLSLPPSLPLSLSLSLSLSPSLSLHLSLSLSLSLPPSLSLSLPLPPSLSLSLSLSLPLSPSISLSLSLSLALSLSLSLSLSLGPSTCSGHASCTLCHG